MKKIKIALSILIIIFIAISCGKSPTEAGDELPSNVLKYSEKQVYLKGDFVYHNGAYYQATTRIVAKDPAQYSITSTSPLNPWKKSTIGEVNSALTTPPESEAVFVVEVWSAKTYIGGDIVKGSDKKYYKAMWWTTGNDPAKAENQNGGGNWGPWKPISEEDARKELGYTAGNANGGNSTNNDDRNEGTIEEDIIVPEVKPEDKVTVEENSDFQTKYAWSEKKVYLENHVAIYNGVYYKAKWWTQGNSPSAAIDNPWDTPWQKISKDVFEALANGTPAVQPPNDSPAAPIPPPIVGGGGSTTTPPPSGGNDGNTGAAGDKWGPGATPEAVSQGYVKEYTWNTLPADIKKALAPIVSGNDFKIKDGNAAFTSFESYINEAKWNQLFRNALANSPHTQGYYTYANFRDAFKMIGKYVYVIAKPNNWTENCYVIYKDGNGTTSEAKIRLISGDATGTTFSSVKVVDYGAFGTEGTDNDKKRVIAGFLAHASQETTGSWATAPQFAFDASVFVNPNATFTIDMVSDKGLDGYLAWAFWYNEEVAYKDIGGTHYVDSYNKVFPPYLGNVVEKAKSYHGRGAFQLSWNYNYGLASAIFFGDARILNKYPEFIVKGVPADKIVEAGFNAGNWKPNGSAEIKGGTMAFLTSLMFWLTPQGSKPSQQDAMILNTDDGSYVPAKAKLSAASGLGKPGFGWTINIINGGREANKSWDGANGLEIYPQVRRRVLHYKLFVAAMGGKLHSSEELDTVGYHSY